VTTVEPQRLSAQNPIDWVSLVESAREIGRAVMRRESTDVRKALGRYRRELARMKNYGPMELARAGGPLIESRAATLWKLSSGVTRKVSLFV